MFNHQRLSCLRMSIILFIMVTAIWAKYCPQCGAENPDDAKFCLQCGKQFPVVDEKSKFVILLLTDGQEIRGKIVSKDTVSIKIQTTYGTGQVLSSKIAKITYIDSLTAMSEKPKFEKKTEGWVCSRCGMTNLATSKYCYNCGQARPTGTSISSPGMDKTAWVCPQCGAKNLSTNKFCYMCGAARKTSKYPTPYTPRPTKKPGFAVGGNISWMPWGGLDGDAWALAGGLKFGINKDTYLGLDFRYRWLDYLGFTVDAYSGNISFIYGRNIGRYEPQQLHIGLGAVLWIGSGSTVSYYDDGYSQYYYKERFFTLLVGPQVVFELGPFYLPATLGVEINELQTEIGLDIAVGLRIGGNYD